MTDFENGVRRFSRMSLRVPLFSLYSRTALQTGFFSARQSVPGALKGCAALDLRKNLFTDSIFSFVYTGNETIRENSAEKTYASPTGRQDAKKGLACRMGLFPPAVRCRKRRIFASFLYKLYISIDLYKNRQDPGIFLGPKQPFFSFLCRQTCTGKRLYMPGMKKFPSFCPKTDR